MSKSAIYVSNQNTQAISVGGLINPGNTNRRYGNNLSLQGNNVQLVGPGYYLVEVSVDCAPTAIGTVTVTLMQDGTVVPGATASSQVTTANNVTHLSFPAIVREYYDGSPLIASTLNVELTGTAASVTNFAMTVIKL